MDLGAVLRHAREQRGLSLDDLSRATKINASTLRLMEANQFDRVAHGIFVRGFLRAYAHEVGLDAEHIVQRYRSEFEPAPQIVVADEAPVSVPGRFEESPERDPSMASRSAWVLMVAALIALAAYFTLRQPQASAPIDASVPAASPVPAAPATTPVATTGPGSASVSPPEHTGLRLEIQAREACWIAATADGVRVAYQVVPAGDRQVIEARSAVVLRVGEPSAITYTINGAPGRPLGPEGEPVTVRLTPQNYREFIAQ